MIQSLRLTNFRDTTIRFGPISVVAGENAIRESNLGDALPFTRSLRPAEEAPCPPPWRGFVVVLAILATALAGCVAAKVTTLPIAFQRPPEPVNTLFVAEGGDLGQMIAFELAAYGFRMTESATGERPLDEVLGILYVTESRGYDGYPDTVIVRVSDPVSGSVYAALRWDNGGAGARGSPADRNQRSNGSEAAVAIATALAPQLVR